MDRHSGSVSTRGRRALSRKCSESSTTLRVHSTTRTPAVSSTVTSSQRTSSSPVSARRKATTQRDNTGVESPGGTPTASTLIGREEIIARAIALIGRADVQLVTLTGTGGTGKTRLALALAERLRDSFDGGVWFVPLAHVSEAALAPSAIAHALGLHDQGTTSLLDAFAAYVNGRRLLLVLDNLEQIVAVATWI